MNSGLPRTNPDSGRVEDLNQGPPDFKSSTLNHLTTAPLSNLYLPLKMQMINLQFKNRDQILESRVDRIVTRHAVLPLLRGDLKIWRDSKPVQHEVEKSMF